VDIYSFGIILWELVTLSTPARGNLRSVHVPNECPADVARLIENCLEANNPDKRPTASEIFDRLMARCTWPLAHPVHLSLWLCRSCAWPSPACISCPWHACMLLVLGPRARVFASCDVGWVPLARQQCLGAAADSPVRVL
jgi:serine/threonine protein kinase